MRKSARKKRIPSQATTDEHGKKIRTEGYKPARKLYINMDNVNDLFLIGNEAAITYHKQGEYYRHVFNKNCQIIFPGGKHFLIIYDPAGRMTWQKSRGIIG